VSRQRILVSSGLSSSVDESRSVIVLKRSMSSGYAGIENPLFFLNHTSMLFGDAKKSVSEVIEELKAL
jgi:H+-translocating NAD(P) transhydrogenase subunit beta